LTETAKNRLFVKIKEQQILVSKMVRFVSFAAVCTEARVATCTSEADESCWSTERRGRVEENKKGAEFLSRMALSAAMEADRRGVHQVTARREYEKTQQVRIKMSFISFSTLFLNCNIIYRVCHTRKTHEYLSQTWLNLNNMRVLCAFAYLLIYRLVEKSRFLRPKS